MTNLRLGIAGVLVMLVAIAFNAWLNHNNHVATCNEIGQVKQGLRETLEEARTFGASSRVRSPAEKLQIVTFYTDALGRLRPKHC